MSTMDTSQFCRPSNEEKIDKALNDYLWGKCTIADLLDLSPELRRIINTITRRGR